jgi:hypothetical protein
MSGRGSLRVPKTAPRMFWHFSCPPYLPHSLLSRTSLPLVDLEKEGLGALRPGRFGQWEEDGGGFPHARHPSLPKGMPSLYHSLFDTAAASSAGGRRAAAGECQSQGCRRRRTRAQEEGENSSVVPMVGGNNLTAREGKGSLENRHCSPPFRLSSCPDLVCFTPASSGGMFAVTHHSHLPPSNSQPHHLLMAGPTPCHGQEPAVCSPPPPAPCTTSRLPPHPPPPPHQPFFSPWFLRPPLRSPCWPKREGILSGLGDTWALMCGGVGGWRTGRSCSTRRRPRFSATR